MPRSFTPSLWSPVIVACAIVMLSGPTPTLRAQPRDPINLTAAFSGVDKLLADFASQNHVPGAAWGIVVDGEIAHIGTTGYEVYRGATKPPIRG